MKRSAVRDFVVGLFVLAGLGAIAYLSMSVGNLSFRRAGSMVLFADFDETGGLKARAPVVISGVKVGQVDSITLDKDYRARAKLALDDSLKLPIDTSASIVTAGVLGDRYISLQLGGDDKELKSGDEIRFTESAVLLERLLGKFMYNRDEPKKE
ncbi:MAG: outer membrane lipid asymmetry maintenance protein MlaD [Candidatus Binatia bacterium]